MKSILHTIICGIRFYIQSKDLVHASTLERNNQFYEYALEVKLTTTPPDSHLQNHSSSPSYWASGDRFGETFSLLQKYFTPICHLTYDFFTLGQSRPLLSLFSSFQQWTYFIIKNFCGWLDSIRADLWYWKQPLCHRATTSAHRRNGISYSKLF